MKKIPKGRLTSINEIQEMLPKKRKAIIDCPITTGIFVSIATYAAAEEAAESKKNTTL